MNKISKKIEPKKIIELINNSTVRITFPKITAKKIIDDCSNKTSKNTPVLCSDWFKNEYFYAIETIRPRTCEIRTQIIHKSKTWNNCDEIIKSEGATMLNFAETIFLMVEYEKLTGNKLFSNWEWTWTSSRDSFGELVSVGDFDSVGAGVRRWEPGVSVSRLGVCFSRVIEE